MCIYDRSGIKAGFIGNCYPPYHEASASYIVCVCAPSGDEGAAFHCCLSH